MQTKKILKYTISLILFLIVILMLQGNSYALNQEVSENINDIDDNLYPGIKQMIQMVKIEHPNWNFKVLYTDITLDEVIANEYTGHFASPRNLIPASYVDEWVCSICGETRYDNGNWKCASEIALRYMIDPRNSINSSDIFQFLQLTYTECNFDSIKMMVSGTFLDQESYINTILDVSARYNINAYYVVALAIQEQGRNGGATVTGTYPGYEGYYNIFNIKASGSGKEAVIRNGLAYAKKKEWTSIEKSIEGGISEIVSGYIKRGQNTLYLQKFDVDNSDGNLYWHQYQQNIMAAQNEGVSMRKIFEQINAIDSAYTFIIPLYKHMPAQISRRPNTTPTNPDTPIKTDLVRVNASGLYMRYEPNGTKISGVLLQNEEVVTRLEKATEKIAGTYWDYVLRADGTRGYAARETFDYSSTYKLYLVPIVEEPETPVVPEQPEEPKEEEQPEIKDPIENEENNNNNDVQEPEKPIENPNELPTTNNEKIKVESETKQVTITPGTTIQEIINLVGKEIKVTDKNGNELDKNAIPGTGCKINDTYTLIMLGDVNGDGEVTALDAAMILRYTVGQYEMSDIQKKSSFLTEEENPTALDAAKILRYTVGQFNINLQ